MSKSTGAQPPGTCQRNSKIYLPLFPPLYLLLLTEPAHQQILHVRRSKGCDFDFSTYAPARRPCIAQV